MRLNDLKNRWSSNTSPKHTESAFDTGAPFPNIPMDPRRTLSSRSDKRRLEVPSSYATPNFSKHVDQAPTSPRKESGKTPASSTFSDDEASAAGEPLFHHDFPSRSFPRALTPDRAFTPERAFTPDTSTRDFAIMEGLAHDDNHSVMLEPLGDDHDSFHERQPRAQSPVRILPSRDCSSPPPYGASKSTEPQIQDQAPPVARQDLPAASEPQPESDISSSPDTSKLASSRDSYLSVQSVDTKASSVLTSNTLPPLQAKSGIADLDHLEPLIEDDPASFDLVLPTDGAARPFQLEDRSELLFSREHLQEIFNDTPLLFQFTNFLSSKRPRSIPLLVYYLDALKALRAINYANAVAEALTPLDGYDFSHEQAKPTLNAALEEKAQAAFDALVQEDLPAFITNTFIQVVSMSIQRRITGTLPSHLREASEGLAEVFCLTDPSRHDNPIVFASEEFHRTTQYGVNYAIGRNCRFLQGPRTNKYSVERLSKAISEQREVSEVFLNYRRDGSTFMNLLMCAPLLDSRGKTRYFIGAQVDVSGLCKEGTDLPGLQRLIAKQHSGRDGERDVGCEEEDEKDSFQELTEMFNETELNMIRKFGGKMHREQVEENEDNQRRNDRPRLHIKESSDPSTSPKLVSALTARNGKLEGIYQNYLLIRPYPSLRILFCSPSLRVPGILQSPFMDRIGGSTRVRETLTTALADGRGVTAKVRWISGRNHDEEGRARWIHCTPLLGQNGAVGVWMVVLIEDENTAPQRKFRQPPPVDSQIRSKKATGHLYDAPISHHNLRRRVSQDAIHRSYHSSDRPRTGYSIGHDSLESFTINPA